MFNRGISELLSALPDFEGLDPALVRRLLSTAYSETLDLRGAGEASASEPAVHDELGRMAAGLEVHAILGAGLHPEMRRACAFVAAEALSFRTRDPVDEAAPELSRIAPGRYRLLEAGLLYLIAGYDSNAAVIAEGIDRRAPARFDPSDVREGPETAVQALRAFLTLGRPESMPPISISAGESLTTRLRSGLWQVLTQAVEAHLEWLRLESPSRESPAVPMLDALIRPLQEEQAAPYSDIAHLARLVLLASEETGERSLRRVPPPASPAAYLAFRERRSRDRPLIWPAAVDYARRCLEGPGWHAAVSVPTGAGKSGLAELAIAHSLSAGWVLYLAPTNALVAQVRRDLAAALSSYPGVEVKGFVGGAELVGAAEEALEEPLATEVLVMTPEKCSLALRRTPEAFSRMSLCVLDECHLISDRGTRGVLAELVISHLLDRAPETRVLMLSAMMSNPEDVAAWLEGVTGRPAVAIDEPWRPTRTLRAVLGFEEARLLQAAGEAAEVLRSRSNRKNARFMAPMCLVAGLQGPWNGLSRNDYVLVPTDEASELELTRTREGTRLKRTGYVNRAVGDLATLLAKEDQHVLAFLPRNRHYSFSVALKVNIASVPRPSVDARVLWQLDLAESELGLPSALRDLIADGIAVHTSAMLAEEQRASEMAFRDGSARIMFATGTLAQGLNLPATAVVFGGTEVGHDPTLTSAERRQRADAQLLNALGRGGRPGVAVRSLGIVVPDRVLTLPAQWSAAPALEAVPVLAKDDASGSVRSRIVPLIDRALRGDISDAAMTAEELAAFAILPLGTGGDEAGRVVSRSYGAWVRGATFGSAATEVAEALLGLGQAFLGSRPRWLAESAYLAGLTVQQMISLHDHYLALRASHPTDRWDLSETASWAQLTVETASSMPLTLLRGVFDQNDLSGTSAEAIHTGSTTRERRAGWDTLAQTLRSWLEGETYERLAVSLKGPEAEGDARRGLGTPLPKVIRVATRVFGFGLTRLCGGLIALHTIGREVEPPAWRLEEGEEQALELTPLAVRSGCGTSGSLAWQRFGGLPRRLAHLAAVYLPPPQGGAAADVRDWVSNARDELSDESVAGWPLNPLDRAALTAWLNLRRAG